ncbi:MAG TPA: TetR family transcriptional regulator [Thermoleophilia bacterium]
MTTHARGDGREPLTREKIIEKALELLDAEGVEGLSMRRLGEALGVEAMALYHHFPSKDAILDGVSTRIVEETGPALPRAAATSDWKAVLLSGPAAAARAMVAHPKAGWLFLGRQFNTTASLQMLETPLEVLYTAGFRGQELVDAAHAYFAYGAGWFFLASGQGGSWSGPSDEAIGAVGEEAPLAVALSSELRDWNRGMEQGLLALLEALEARLEK